MSQALQSPYAVPVLQIVAGVAALQIFSGEKSPLTDYAAEKIRELTDELIIAGKNVIYDSPVIAFSAALAYAGQLFNQRFVVTSYPSWSIGSLGESPLKVASCVAGILTVRSALSTYLKNVMDNSDDRDNDKNVRDIRKAMACTIVPFAVGCTAAYYAGVPVKLAQTALFTAALIPAVKQLGNGFKNLIK